MRACSSTSRSARTRSFVLALNLNPMAYGLLTFGIPPQLGFSGVRNNGNNVAGHWLSVGSSVGQQRSTADGVGRHGVPITDAEKFRACFSGVISDARSGYGQEIVKRLTEVNPKPKP